MPSLDPNKELGVSIIDAYLEFLGIPHISGQFSHALAGVYNEHGVPNEIFDGDDHPTGEFMRFENDVIINHYSGNNCQNNANNLHASAFWGCR